MRIIIDTQVFLFLNTNVFRQIPKEIMMKYF